MYKFGLIKVTLIYILSIAFVFFSNIGIGYGIVIFCFGIGLLIIRKASFWSVLFCVLGFTIFQFSNIFPKQAHFSDGYCKINKVVETKFDSRLFCDCKSEKEEFKSLIYFKSEFTKPKVGETYFINKPFKKVKSTALFGEFSYADYLIKKGIYFENKNVREFDLKPISSPNFINNKQRLIILEIDNILKEYFSLEDAALIKALCFGNKSEVSKERLEVFRQAGLMHIIAVSGMHVGVIQMFLLFILRSIFGRTPLSLKIQHGVVVVFLIGFAWLCQFSPSVVRSVFMFSLLFYSTISKRLIQTVHVLFLTALVILIVQPLQVFDIGFQFSYLATLGIILFKDTIEKIDFLTNWRVINGLVKLCFISLIAQVFLSPLLFYYFGEIPIWFLAFNIPGAFFVSGILILIFIFFVSTLLGGWLLDEMAALISVIMKIFNKLISLTNLTDQLFFHFKLNSIIEVFCYSLALFLIVFSFIEFKWRLLKYFCLTVLLLMGCKIQHFYEVKNRFEILAWNTNKDQNITLKKNNTIHFISTYLPEYSQRLKNYALAQNSKLIHQPCSLVENDIESFLVTINTASNDSVICLLFNNNPAIQQYLEKNYQYVEILYFGKPSFKDRKNQNPKNYLTYGPTFLDVKKTILFYP